MPAMEQSSDIKDRFVSCYLFNSLFTATIENLPRLGFRIRGLERRSTLVQEWRFGAQHAAFRRMLSLKGDLQGAEKYYLASLDWAREQQAKSWELRTSTSLARLWQSQGKGKEALDLLKPVYDWFTEGFDTKNLIEAKALLDQLR